MIILDKVKETFWLSTDKTLFANHLISPFAYGESLLSDGYQYNLEHFSNLQHSWGFELVTEGSGTGYVDSESVVFSEGDVIVFNSTRCNGFTITRGGYCRKKVVIFNSNPAIDCIMEANAVRDIHVLKLPEPWNLRACMKRLRETVSSDKGLVPETVSMRGYEILLEFCRQARIINNPKSIDYVIALVTNKLSHKYSLDDLASMAGMKQRTFLRRFKQYANCPPITFIERKRMEHAAFLLTSEQLSIGETAALCGYTDLAFFSRVFRKYYGRPPGRYRKFMEKTQMTNARL